MQLWFPSRRKRPRIKPYVARSSSRTLDDVVTQCNRTLYDCYSTDYTVGPGLEKAWASRVEVEWAHGRLSVLSAEGLISMKTLRGSGQDLADIQHLRDQEEG